jgi:hypothetical protein
MDEFQTGTTWSGNMRDAAERCLRLIPLYSQDYWQSGACIAEFDAFWQKHLQTPGARCLLPLEVQPCSVPDIHKTLLWKPIHSLTREDALTAIRRVLDGIFPITPNVQNEPEPQFPGIAATPHTATIEWPEKVDELRWPLANHDEARAAFAELVTRATRFKFLAIQGSSETGKSHLTKQFLTNAQRRITACRCARFDFKGTDQLDQAFADFALQLDIPQPPVSGNLIDNFRHILQILSNKQKPTLLLFDTYENAGDADHWVRESLLTSLHRHTWLRVVIAGQKVPPCHANPWGEDSKFLPIQPPSPDHWVQYAKDYGRRISASTLKEVHKLTGGKASILAELCAPNN